MYAVIKEGGKQFKVQEGDLIRVPKIAKKEGSKITIKDVLMIADEGKVTVGTPLVKAAKVDAKVVQHSKDKKIIVFNYRRRKSSMKKQGHRQDFTEIKIDKIHTA